MPPIPTAVRARRAGVVLLVALALALVPLAVAVGPSADASGAGAPVVRVVAGHRTITVAWAAVPHATRYDVVLTAPHHPTRTARTAGLHARFKGLTDGTPYLVRVTSHARTGDRVSATASGTPAAGVPQPITGVTARGAGANRILVRWPGIRRATKVAVAAGSDSITRFNRFTTAWLPATTRSVTITVPKRLRDKLGVVSGQPVFVKVIASNATTAQPAKELFFDARHAFRLSPPGTWSMAGTPNTPTEHVSRITVGELNVQSVSATATFTAGDQWPARLPRIAATVLASHPDLLATAELSTQLTAPCPAGNAPSLSRWCTDQTQYMDLARALATGPHPYALATADAYAAVHAEMARDGRKWDGAVTDGSHLFYDPEKMTLLAHGYISPVYDLHMDEWTPAIGDRWSSWGEFQLLDGTNRRFYAVATHFPVGKTAAIVALRHEEAERLTAYLDHLAGPTPIVFAGDLNADAVRDPKPAATVFVQHGYADAAATTHRSGIRYSTSNGTNGTDGADPGYPVHAVEHAYPTSRIDYILVKHSPVTFRYTNVLHLTGNRFTPAYQGTDHNLQMAWLGIGDP
ncbi:hypothetical protein [uncultured Amnibacterium sp.]|uniref:hypothetical protein n=1 Tax=uncultured Amnibacterium sp. TaxID=1631851 RepID=UPI0035CB6015